MCVPERLSSSTRPCMSGPGRRSRIFGTGCSRSANALSGIAVMDSYSRPSASIFFTYPCTVETDRLQAPAMARRLKCLFRWSRAISRMVLIVFLLPCCCIAFRFGSKNDQATGYVNLQKNDEWVSGDFEHLFRSG